MTPARLILAACLAALPAAAGAQALDGIRVGDSLLTHAARLGDPGDFGRTGDDVMLAWNREGGRHLALAVEPDSRRILYVQETTSSQAPETAPALAWLVFGKTTLAEIRHRFGSLGFTLAGGPADAGDAISVNCYDVAGQPNLVLAVITAGPGGRRLPADPQQQRLAGIILADSAYLQRSWGSKRATDPAYRPVRLP